MEKQKQKKKAPSFDGGNSPFTDTQHATVCCGVYQEKLPVAGKTIGEIRSEFGNQLEIADQAVATVSGVEQGNDYRVGANEIVLFIQQAGEKGTDKKLKGKPTKPVPDTPEMKGMMDSIANILGNLGVSGIKFVDEENPENDWGIEFEEEEDKE